MFEEISVNKIKDNAFHLIGKQWMLITAGNRDSFNTMTAAWGGFGFLWNFPVVFIYIRPQRHTYGFVEENPFFTLAFFEKEHKNILTYCGSHSGKDNNKVKETGLIPLETNLGNIYFEQSRLVLECKKVYADDIKPELFEDRLIQRNYPNKDYHRMYIGKVVKCLEKTEQ
jgi:flavin reductase (DIM6/NTAB) family NADH-FMN oxidoreductase RutF